MFKIRNIVSFLATAGILVAGLFSYAERHEMIRLFQPPVQTPGDSTKAKQPYKPSRRPTYKPGPRYGDPYTNRESKSPMELKTPENVKTQTDLDTTQESFQITEKAGDLDYRPPTEMKFKDYADWRNKQMSKTYWRNKSEATSGGTNTPISAKPKGLNPKIQMPPVFDRIFGGNYIDINPNGMVLLDFGGQYQKTNNPAIPIRQQRSGGFRFDQQINFNLVGKVGERLTIRANWDTKATFDFDNNIKIEYKALEQDIIKRIELGNISFATNSALITGAQNIFGVKAQLQFGRLSMTTAVGNQRSKVDEIVIPGGSAGPGKDYEIKANQYDEHRHFWLGQFFRNNFDKWMASSPFIKSGVQITRVEVYVTNRTITTDGTRNVTAYLDLGEAMPYNVDIRRDGVNLNEFKKQHHLWRDSVASNSSNTLYKRIRTNSGDRTGSSETTGKQYNMQSGIDYEIIKTAKQLTRGRDFKVNEKLGYITLTTQLRTDEALAVSYEYSYQGAIYKVGELMEDYNDVASSDNIFLKMLRPANVKTEIPTFNLMMKNIYQLPSTNINRNGFQLRVIYKDDSTGIDNPFIQQGSKMVSLHGEPTGQSLTNFPLVRLFNVDNLNPNGDRDPDGNWDYVGDVTLDSINGRVIFGVKEPFGKYLESHFDTTEGAEKLLIDKYVFKELYAQTRNNAEQISKKNKFFLKGRYQSGSSQEIQLQGLNIAQGSVRVLSGSTTLVEGTDYTVNYELGRVRIVNPGILTSGNDITIRFEKADLFNFRQKTLYGARLDYRIHRDFNIGGTFMHLRERPLITRVSFGDDPIFNTMWGLDFNYTKESRFLTKMVDALPLVQTKEPSSITLKGEVAQIIPGTPPQIGKENANMFIDDFEGTETPYELKSPLKWVLGAPPIQFYDQAKLSQDPLSFAYKRAKLCWYTIDQTAFYYQGGAQKPGNITEEELANHYVRSIAPTEIYPQRSLTAGYSNETTLDLAYFPDERGMYNYNPGILPNGKLPNPKENFAAISRAVTFDTDFDNANIQYIEFWMMDPFISGTNGNLKLESGLVDNSLNPGGQIWFHLGSVSEDIIKDGKHEFENGLPPNGDMVGAEQTAWGKVTTAPYLNNAFNIQENSRTNQDVGLDGLKTVEEPQQYPNFVNAVNNMTDETAKASILEDVSGDNFQYFLNVNSPHILNRYRNYNGMENNSSISTSNGFVQSNTMIPDNEDLNQNNTVSDLEQYYEYKIDIKKGPDGKMDERANGYVVSKIVPSGHSDVTWYQVRIPIRTSAKPINGINDFKSIRFIRMVMTGWEKPVVLRLSQFQMVGSLWRPLNDLETDQGPLAGGPTEPRSVSKVQLSTVNIEENGSPPPGITPYVVPPDFIRDRDNTSTLNRLQNEQSLRICVDNLQPGDVAPAYKLINLNFINSKRIRMFLHAESSTARDYELEGFLRIGTDFDQNYYDVRVPLKLTPAGTGPDAQAIWPAENDVDVPLEDLSFVKTERNKSGVPHDQIFSLTINGKIISVRGNPDYTSTQVAMIGIQNPVDNTRQHQICIWADELRTSGVNKSPGYAAIGTINAKLADLANVTATGSYKSAGFGAIDQKITSRQRNNTYQYGAASNITMEKFIPGKTGLKVPLYVSYDKKIIKPEFDPLNPDTKLSTSLASLEGDEREERASIVIDRSTRRSISLNNLQKVKTGQNPKNHFYDVENLSLTLGYSDIQSSNYLTQRYFFKNYKVGLAYNYGGNPKALEPLKGIKSQSKYVQLLTSFNVTLLPSNLSFRTDLDRRFAVTQLRGNSLYQVKPMYEKSYYLNRSYGLRWAFTKSLGMDYRSNVSAIIDEPTGEINDERARPDDPNSTTSRKDSVIKNLKRFGRVKNFEQNFNFTYRTPLDKIPLTDWTQADLGYNTTYMWKAGALGDDSLGNQIQNSRTFTANGKLDLLKLYNKIKFLREVNAPLTQTQQEHNQKREQWKRQLENPSLKQPEKDSLKKLIDKQYISEVRPVRGIFQGLMLFKNFNMTYERSEGTALPGFNPKPKYFGLDEEDMAPGIPFILGDQSDRIKQEAAEKDWIAKSRLQSSPFIKTRGTKITYRTSLEPIKQFRIQLEGRQEQTQTYNEFYRYNDMGELVSENPTRSGSFKTSIVTVATMFSKDDPVTNKNQVFETFVQNRNVISGRMNAQRPNDIGRYDTSSQEVQIPAFLAAYTGRDPGKVGLSAFPRIPIPNWRIDYGGLSSVGIVKRYFSSVNLNHSYTSTYNVANYTSSLRYSTDKINSESSVFDMPMGTDTNGRAIFIPTYIIGQVSIQEAFSPLIGINMKTKKNITFNIKYNYTRNLNLSTSNSQVMEMRSQDWSFSVGYTKTGLVIPLKYKGRPLKPLKNEITFRFDFTIRDNRTVQRRPDDINVLTQGSQQIQIKPTINYRVNDRLSLQFYYDRTINTPRVSSSFKRINTLFGVQVRFSLS